MHYIIKLISTLLESKRPFVVAVTFSLAFGVIFVLSSEYLSEGRAQDSVMIGSLIIFICSFVYLLVISFDGVIKQVMNSRIKKRLILEDLQKEKERKNKITAGYLSIFCEMTLEHQQFIKYLYDLKKHEVWSNCRLLIQEQGSLDGQSINKIQTTIYQILSQYCLAVTIPNLIEFEPLNNYQIVRITFKADFHEFLEDKFKMLLGKKKP